LVTGNHFNITFHAKSGGTLVTATSPSSNPVKATEETVFYTLPSNWDGIPLNDPSPAKTLTTIVPSGPIDADYAVAIYAFIQDEDGGVTISSIILTVYKLDLSGTDATNFVNNYLATITASTPVSTILATLGDITDLLSDTNTSNPNATIARANAKEGVINLISNVLDRILTNQPDNGLPRINDGTASIVSTALYSLTGAPSEVTTTSATKALSSVTTLMNGCAPSGIPITITPAALPISVAETALSTISNVLTSDLYKRNNDTNATVTSNYESHTSPYRDATQDASTAISRAILRDAKPGDSARSIVALPSTNETTDAVTGCQASLALTVARLSSTGPAASINTASAPCGNGNPEPVAVPHIEIAANQVVDTTKVDISKGVDLQVLSYGSSPMNEVGNWGNLNGGPSFGSNNRRRRLGIALEGPTGSEGKSIDLLPSSGLDSGVVSIQLQQKDGSPIEVSNTKAPIIFKLPIRTGTNATQRADAIDFDPPAFNISCPSTNANILPSGTLFSVLQWYPSGLSSSSISQAEILSYTNTTYQVPIYWRTTGTKDRLPKVFGSKRTETRDPQGKITGYTMITIPVYKISVDCGGIIGKQTLSCGTDPAIDEGPRNITFNCPSTRVQPTCAFWNETSNSWSDNGCTAIGATDEYIICSCNHLTEFGARFSALADQQQDMFAMNDLLSDPDVLNQYPYVFILIGTIGGVILLLSFVTLYLDSKGDARYFKLLTLDEEVQTLRIIEEAKGHHFILDRALDRKYARMNLNEKAKFGRLSNTDIMKAKANQGNAGMLSNLMGDSVLGNTTTTTSNIVNNTNTNTSQGRDSIIPVEAGDPVVIDPSANHRADPYTTGLYLKVVDSFDRQKVSLTRLREEIVGIKPSHPNNVSSGTLSVQNPMNSNRNNTDLEINKPTSIENAANPQVIEKARAKLAKLSSASSWSCVRMWKLRKFILRSWFTMIWTKHPYFAVFTRHDSRSSRTQRLLVIAANLLTNLFATAFWYAWRNEGGENPDLPEMDETELLVCAGLATAMQLPINMAVEYLMETAGEANFKVRYPFLSAELERRKRMQLRLSKLSRPLLEAEVAKYQEKLDRLHSNAYKHHRHGVTGVATPSSLSPVSPGRDAYATVSHYVRPEPEPEVEKLAALPAGLSIFAAAKAMKAFKKAGAKAKAKVKARKIDAEEDPLDIDDGFDYGWVDAPPGCQERCGCVLRLFGRHPSQKEAYVARKRENERQRLKRYQAMADARDEARRVVEQEKLAKKQEKLAKKRNSGTSATAATSTTGKSSLLLALKSTNTISETNENDKITVITPPEENASTGVAKPTGSSEPTNPKRKLKLLDKHASAFGYKRTSTSASRNSVTSTNNNINNDEEHPFQSTESTATPSSVSTSSAEVKPSDIAVTTTTAATTATAVATVAKPSLSITPVHAADDSDSDSSSEYDSSSDEEDEGAEEVDTGFLEDFLSAGDSGERLFVLLQGFFSCTFSGVLYVYHIFKPLPPPLSPEEALQQTLEKMKEKKLKRAEQKAEMAKITIPHHSPFMPHAPHLEFDNILPTKKKSSLHSLMNKDPTKQKCYGFTKEGIFAYSVTLAWMGFCLYYVLLFGLYQGEEATYSFMQDWAISQAFASFGLAPLAFLIIILWMYVIWPTWLPYLIWVPGLGKVLASREARAINASDGSASLSGRMEHLTLVRAAGYASMLSPQTAILAYGASAAVAAAYGGIASAVSKITGRAATKKAQLKGRNSQNGTATAETLAKEKELTTEQRNELIIRRYLLEQIILVEKARRKIDHHHHHHHHRASATEHSASFASNLAGLQENQQQRLNNLNQHSTLTTASTTNN